MSTIRFTANWKKLNSFICEKLWLFIAFFIYKLLFLNMIKTRNLITASHKIGCSLKRFKCLRLKVAFWIDFAAPLIKKNDIKLNCNLIIFFSKDDKEGIFRIFLRMFLTLRLFYYANFVLFLYLCFAIKNSNKTTTNKINYFKLIVIQ